MPVSNNGGNNGGNGGGNGGNNNGRNNGNGGPPNRWPLIGGLLGVALLFNIMANNDAGDTITPNEPGADPAATEQQQQSPGQSGIIEYTEFKDYLEDGEVESVLRQRKPGGDQIIQFTLEDGRTMQTWDAGEGDLIDEIQEADATFKQLETEQPSFLESISHCNSKHD